MAGATVELAAADAKSARVQLQATVLSYNMKIDQTRKAATVAMNNKAVEMQAQVEAKLRSIKGELESSGPLQEMLEIESFDEDTVNELRTRARDALLTMEIEKEEKVDDVSQDLRDLEGMNTELITKLAEGGVHTRDDLADLAVDELTEMAGVDEAQARELIMKAREHWFAA